MILNMIIGVIIGAIIGLKNNYKKIHQSMKK